ncbi:MAG TPA: ribonuclease III, partial [Hyphomonas sp.]|nr:ribonuclease III [Hyphomonas sp.]
MDESARLGLPYLIPNQAQKHVTVNEAFRKLDQMVQLCVQSKAISIQPEAPS